MDIQIGIQTRINCKFVNLRAQSRSRTQHARGLALCRGKIPDRTFTNSFIQYLGENSPHIKSFHVTRSPSVNLTEPLTISTLCGNS